MSFRLISYQLPTSNYEPTYENLAQLISLEEEAPGTQDARVEQAITKLDITEEELKAISNVKSGVYQKYLYKRIDFIEKNILID